MRWVRENDKLGLDYVSFIKDDIKNNAQKLGLLKHTMEQ